MDDELKNVYDVIKFVVENRREGVGFLPSTVMPANVLTNKEANQILRLMMQQDETTTAFKSGIAGMLADR